MSFLVILKLSFNERSIVYWIQVLNYLMTIIEFHRNEKSKAAGWFIPLLLQIYTIFLCSEEW